MGRRSPLTHTLSTPHAPRPHPPQAVPDLMQVEKDFIEKLDIVKPEVKLPKELPEPHKEKQLVRVWGVGRERVREGVIFFSIPSQYPPSCRPPTQTNKHKNQITTTGLPPGRPQGRRRQEGRTRQAGQVLGTQPQDHGECVFFFEFFFLLSSCHSLPVLSLGPNLTTRPFTPTPSLTQ
jgi:hypothetical protein